jgi:hypothetical protein
MKSFQDTLKELENIKLKGQERKFTNFNLKLTYDLNDLQSAVDTIKNNRDNYSVELLNGDLHSLKRDLADLAFVVSKLNDLVQEQKEA